MSGDESVSRQLYIETLSISETELRASLFPLSPSFSLSCHCLPPSLSLSIPSLPPFFSLSFSSSSSLSSLTLCKLNWGQVCFLLSFLPSLHPLFNPSLSLSLCLQVSMYTTSQLPEDLLKIKKRLGLPLVKFESPIFLSGFHHYHILDSPSGFADALGKHYKGVSLKLWHHWWLCHYYVIVFVGGSLYIPTINL